MNNVQTALMAPKSWMAARAFAQMSSIPPRVLDVNTSFCLKFNTSDRFYGRCFLVGVVHAET